jgi:hypothetical protein
MDDIKDIKDVEIMEGVRVVNCVVGETLWMELFMTHPTKDKIERAVQLLFNSYGKIKRVQIDIFDDLEALYKRGDASYSTDLINKHWLVSITDLSISRFYLKERPDITGPLWQ